MIEDRPEDAELTMMALQAENLADQMIWLKDGEEALDYLRCKGQYESRKDGNPRVILLDLNMPKLSGIDVLKELKNDPHLKHIPVIVLTTSKMDSDIDVAYDLGVNSYIVKPVEFGKFADIVKRLGVYWLLVNQAP